MGADLNPDGKARRGFTAFRLGLLVGFGLVAAIGAAIYFVAAPLLSGPWYNADVSTLGQDVSQHGGSVVVVRNEAGAAFRQRCNGVCDDVRLQVKAGETSLAVDVLDAAGQCVACTRTGAYVTGGTVVAWKVAGKDKLDVSGQLVPGFVGP